MSLNEARNWAVVATANLNLHRDLLTLPAGKCGEIALQFGLSERTISRIVSHYFEQINNDVLIPEMGDLRKNHSGAHTTKTLELVESLKEANAVTQGTSSDRAVADRAGIPRSTAQRWMKEEKVERHFIWLHPKLSENHRIARLNWCLNRIDFRNRKFRSFQNVVHIDESWFYLRSDKKIVRVFPGEDIPEGQSVQHKKHIPKVMFLTVLALPRPEFGFDGKIGIWRVCEEVTAARKSKSYNKGDVFDQDCTVTSEWYLDCMTKVGGVYEAIRNKMHWMVNDKIYVQHDGAPGHNGKGNLEAFDDINIGETIELIVVTQPAQSPDLNINDLGFFCSLKSKVNEVKSNDGSLSNMIDTIYDEYNSYDSDTIVRLWACQVEYYRQIVAHVGDNKFKNPHSGINKRQLHEIEVIDYDIIEADVAFAYEYLND